MSTRKHDPVSINIWNLIVLDALKQISEEDVHIAFGPVQVLAELLEYCQDRESHKSELHNDLTLSGS